MAQVSVTIDGRKYRLACNEGEEARLELLAGVIDDKIGEMRKEFGEIGDQRLVIMAALDHRRQSGRSPRRGRGRAQALRRRRRARPSPRLEPRRARFAARVARRAARGRRGGLIAARAPARPVSTRRLECSFSDIAPRRARAERLVARRTQCGYMPAYGHPLLLRRGSRPPRARRPRSTTRRWSRRA